MTDLFEKRKKIIAEIDAGFEFCCDECPFTWAELLGLIGARTHLESRIRQQRHEITSNQAKLRERNLTMRRWYEGREALLQQQLQQTTSAMYGWKAEADRLRAELKAAKA